MSPITAMAASPGGRGYWLTASDGGVFAFGDASFEGGAVDVALTSPVTGIAATPDGGGYWLVLATGRVLGFGNAR